MLGGTYSILVAPIYGIPFTSVTDSNLFCYSVTTKSQMTVGKSQSDLLQDVRILTQIILVLYSTSNYTETDETTVLLSLSMRIWP